MKLYAIKWKGEEIKEGDWFKSLGCAISAIGHFEGRVVEGVETIEQIDSEVGPLWHSSMDTTHAGKTGMALKLWWAEQRQEAQGEAASAFVAVGAMTPHDAIYAKAEAMDNQDVPLEEWPAKLIEALGRSGYAVVPVEVPPAILGDAARAGVFETGNPRHGWDYLIARTRALTEGGAA